MRAVSTGTRPNGKMPTPPRRRALIMNKRFIRSIAAATVALCTSLTFVAAQTFNLNDTMPFDAAVRTATLSNGLKYFVRQNSRPAKRVSLRLAVKAGSLFEADDRQGAPPPDGHMGV